MLELSVLKMDILENLENFEKFWKKVWKKNGKKRYGYLCIVSSPGCFGQSLYYLLFK